jgi:tRNA dimethylallyltransferase
LRARLEKVAERKGVERLHRMLARVDRPSAERIQSRDLKRLVRALEVFFLTGRPLTEHFADTESPLPEYDVAAFALRIPAAATAARVAARVDAQFDHGLLDEIRSLLAAGVPETAHPFSGLVYRQALEHLRGVRDERATRELIVRENRRYARRQLIWFRKEPNLQWFHAAGEREETQEEVARALAAMESLRDATNP